jgi:glucose/arabinose dehydrogenase
MAVHNKSGEKPIITPKGCPKIDLSLLEASPSRDHHGSEKPVWAMGQRNLYGLRVRETRMGYGSEKPVWATGQRNLYGLRVQVCQVWVQVVI